MGFPAKGAFALTFLFKSSLRGCLRVFFYRQVLAAFGRFQSLSEDEEAEEDDEDDEDFDIASARAALWRRCLSAFF